MRPRVLIYFFFIQSCRKYHPTIALLEKYILHRKNPTLVIKDKVNPKYYPDSNFSLILLLSLVNCVWFINAVCLEHRHPLYENFMSGALLSALISVPVLMVATSYCVRLY